jgi:hypothetical protein
MPALAQNVECVADVLIVTLLDGQAVSAPMAWFPRLFLATPAQRANWKLLGDGEGIHWPEIDEDLSVIGLLKGSH